MGMCRWIGSHFHNWINYKFNGVVHFGDFRDRKILASRDLKIGRFVAKVKMGSIIGHRKDYRLLWGRGSERPAAHTQQKLTQVLLPRAFVSFVLHEWL